MDAADLPSKRVLLRDGRPAIVRHYLDLHTVRGWWRGKWGIGEIDLSTARFSSPDHAVLYITKYIVKPPVDGWPTWVQETERLIRTISASKAVGALVNPSPAAPDDLDDGREEDEDDTRRAPRRPFIVRVSGCGLSSTLWRVRVDRDTGEVRRSWLQRLPLPASSIPFVATLAGGVPLRPDVRHRSGDGWERTSIVGHLFHPNDWAEVAAWLTHHTPDLDDQHKARVAAEVERRRDDLIRRDAEREWREATDPRNAVAVAA